MDIILYIDCDGVIYNTIEIAFKLMNELQIDRKDSKIVDDFFRNIDWQNLMNQSEIINNSINKIKLLQDSNLYKDIIILTKLNGNYYVEKVKRDTFDILLPKIKVLTLPLSYSKASIVNAKNNILVDDELRNIKLWNNAGGIGIQFIKDTIDFDHNIINDLSDIEKTSGVKILRKTR